MTKYTAEEFFTKGTGNVVLCGSTKYFFQAMRCNKLLHFHKIYQSNAAVIVTDETNYIGDSTKKEIDFIEKLGIPYFWFNGKEFSGETTVTPKDHLNSYLPIMEDINKGKFNG